MADSDWQPAEGPLQTRWTPLVSPSNALPEYPRPQMVRPEWLNLNGLWQFAIASEGERPPIGRDLPDQILVPFPVESALSGVMKRAERVWYRRTFSVDKWREASENDQRILLHFGAVDWEASVWINGQRLGTHRGGYDSFTFDITDALQPQGDQEIVVGVFDPTDAGTQPRGKQVRQPHGIWYTPTTGIWQTVWLEPVPTYRIERLRLTPDADAGRLKLQVEIGGGIAGEFTVRAVASDAGQEIARGEGSVSDELELKIDNPELWSPDRPHLYDLEVTLLGQNPDTVTSYFGMRKIGIGKDEKGVTRLLLNDEPLFQIGVLDQGFWPDGLYAAPTDQALQQDLLTVKRLGFNLIRKHVKIEPARWYTWCDKLGLLVWQDMPSGDKYIGGGDPDLNRSPESAQQFELELRRLIETRYNHPSIIMWVLFNEGWGQYDTQRLTEWVRQLDPTRLVDSASGWSDRGTGDVHDIHAYPGPASPQPEDKRAAVLGEFGGLGLPLAGHTWTDQKNWGYRNLQSKEQVTDQYVQLIDRLRLLIGDPGLSAAGYTQLSDVETECNGLMTYDRAELKVDPKRVAQAHARLHRPPPTVETIVPTARERGIEWRHTFEEPAEDWFKPDFDDRSWKTGPAGFGTEGTPGAVVRTVWNTPDIWLRRTITLPSAARPATRAGLRLLVHHDEDTEIYVNGVLVTQATGYTVAYELLRMTPEGRAALRPGENTIAVHCHQTGGGQYIDLGLVEIVENE